MPESDPHATLGRAVALHKAGRYDEAEALYRAVVQQTPNLFDAQHLLGIVRLQRGDATTALACFDRAVAIDSSSARARHNRGRALEALNRPAEALAAYDMALALDPANPEFLNDRGLALREIGRLPDALASFERALAARADFRPALGNRALTLMRLGRPAAALDDLDRLLALDPDNIEALVNRARVLQSFGDAEAAIAAYRRVLALKPDFAPAQGALADALAVDGHDGEAEALARAVLAGAKDPRDRFLALRTLALLPQPPGDLDLAAMLEAMSVPAGMAPQQADTMRAFALAALRHKAGDHEAAWQHLEAAHRPMRAAGVAENRTTRRQSYAAALAAVDASPSELEAASPQRADLPISLFILGPSRSGKTMLERLAASIPGVQAGGENALARIARERALAGPARERALAGPTRAGRTSPGLRTDDGANSGFALPSDARAQFSETYAALLAQRAGDARMFTGTAPGNIRDIVELAALVPNLRLVFLDRARDDTLLRIYMKQYTGNDYAADPAAIAEYLEFYADMTDRLVRRFPHRALRLRYEDVVADPAAARAAVARLGDLAPPAAPPPPIPDDRDCARPYANIIAAALSNDQA
jgi:tetratricopeptide (TPR) repeat protein